MAVDPQLHLCCGLGGEGPHDRRSAEALLVGQHSRHAEPEQAGGSAATAAASARLTRRKGVLRQARLGLLGAAFPAQLPAQLAEGQAPQA